MSCDCGRRRIGDSRYGSRTKLRDAGNLKASELVPAALLKGPFHSVDENVVVAGADPDFTIHSQYGTWVARGHEMLIIRVSELPAFEQLAKVSKSDEFMKSAGTAVAAPVKAVGQFIESPLETTGNVFSGIGLIASRVGRVAEQSLTRVGDTMANNAPAQKQILEPVAPPLDIGTRNEARLTFMATGATPDDETVRPEPVKGPFMVRQAHHERDCFTQMFHVSR